MREHLAFGNGWTEAQEFERPFKAAVDGLVWIGRQVAGEDGGFGFAVKFGFAEELAILRRSGDAFKFNAALLLNPVVFLGSINCVAPFMLVFLLKWLTRV